VGGSVLCAERGRDLAVGASLLCAETGESERWAIQFFDFKDWRN